MSLVAEDPDRSVVGHVICTAGFLDGWRAVGLGPIDVAPSHQGKAVGAALMHAVLGAADALECDLVVLLGHLEYYPRFGFVTAQTLNIESPDPAWGEHFQARPPSRWTPEVRGAFRYAAPFEPL